MAHVLRVLLDGMPPGALVAATKERARLVESATDTLKFLNANPQGDPSTLMSRVAYRGYSCCSPDRFLVLGKCALLSPEPSCLASASLQLQSKRKLSLSLVVSPAEPLQDLLALRYCLCSIVRCMALQFADVDSSAFTLHLRRMLFLAFSTWTEEGAIPGVSASRRAASLLTDARWKVLIA